MKYKYNFYCSYFDNTHKIKDTLNKYGEEGWELVSVLGREEYKEFYFKKLINN